MTLRPYRKLSQDLTVSILDKFYLHKLFDDKIVTGEEISKFLGIKNSEFRKSSFETFIHAIIASLIPATSCTLDV